MKTSRKKLLDDIFAIPQGYSVYSEFDLEQHKQHYTNYLEVLITEDGTVVYAVPSHQEKAIALACERRGISREQLCNECPPEYYFDFMTWLLEQSHSVALWSDAWVGKRVTRAQYNTMRRLKMHGVYTGTLPSREILY